MKKEINKRETKNLNEKELMRKKREGRRDNLKVK